MSLDTSRHFAGDHLTTCDYVLKDDMKKLRAKCSGFSITLQGAFINLALDFNQRTCTPDKKVTSGCNIHVV